MVLLAENRSRTEAACCIKAVVKGAGGRVRAERALTDSTLNSTPAERSTPAATVTRSAAGPLPAGSSQRSTDSTFTPSASTTSLAAATSPQVNRLPFHRVSSARIAPIPARNSKTLA